MKKNFYHLRIKPANFLWLGCLLILLTIHATWAQQSNLSTTERKPWTQGQGFSPTVTQTNSKTGVAIGNWTNPNNVVNSESGSSTANLLGAATLNLTVTQGNGIVFNASNEVGFRFSVSGLAASTVKVSTISSTGTEVESRTSTVSVIGANTIVDFGFITTLPYTSLRITYDALGAGGIEVFYAYQRAYVQPAAEIACNTSQILTTADHPVIATPVVNGLATYGGIENVIDPILTNSASLMPVVAGYAGVNVRRVGAPYNATETSPYYVGFDVQLPLIGVSALNGMTVRTYRQGFTGVVQEANAGSGLLAGTLFGGKARVGFVATEPFDAIEFIVGGITVTLPYQVFNPVIERLCEGPDLICNATTKVIKQNGGFPFSINFARTTIEAAVSVGSIDTPEKALDANWEDPAIIALTASAAGIARFSFVDPITDYPNGTFVGIEISNTSLLDASLLSNITINLYRNGDYSAPVQTVNASTASLIDAGSGLLGDGRQTIGLIASTSFDEVELTINTALGADLGSTNIHGLILKKYCEGPALECNTPTATVTNTADPSDSHPVDINSIRTGIVSSVACAGCNLSGVNNVIDENLTNYASINMIGAVGTVGSISVKNGHAPYPAGTYAGYTISNTNIVSLSLLNTVTITPYINGVPTAQGALNSGSGSLLAGSSDLLFGGMEGTQLVGFVATHPFDEVQISFASPVGASLSEYRVHNFVVEKLCAGPELVCNVDTKMVKDMSATPENRYPVSINSARTGTGGGISITGIDNPNKAIDPDWNDPVEINLTAAAIGGYAQLSIMDGVTDYPIGTFAGIEIANTSLLNAAALENITLYTYLNGSATAQQTINSSSGLVSLNTSVIGDGRQILGFIATAPFDEVQLVITQAVAGADLGITEVYGLILKKFCEGPALDCNTPTALRTGFTDPTLNHPVIINAVNTKITGGACVGCNITDTQAIIDNSTATAATINLLGSVLNTASVSVKNGFAPYPAGTYAGFTISGDNLADISILDNIQLVPYLNGVPQPALSVGDAGFASASTDLILGSPGTRLVGFISSAPFDELQLVYTKPVSVELAEIQIHDFVVQEFCEKEVECLTTYLVTSPDFPVVVNSTNTGVTGLACVECAVYNEGNILREYNPATPNAFSTANITLGVGLGNTGSISIKIGEGKFPANSFGGFVIQNANGIFELSLLNSITVTAYNNGLSVGSATGNSLIGASLVLNLLGTSTAQQTVGFKPPVEYDELQISISSLADAGVSINVLGAILDTQGATIDGETCESLPVKLANFTATREGNQANVQWQTTEEVNSDRFEVMRSSDAKNWMTIATIEAQRNSTSLQTYQHVDATPAKGLNYYRLKMIDLDGTFEMSPLASLLFDDVEGVVISPNPVVNKLMIKGITDAEVQKVELRSTSGQLIDQSAVIREMNMQHLPTGMYIISITKKDGSVTAYKVIKR